MKTRYWLIVVVVAVGTPLAHAQDHAGHGKTAAAPQVAPSVRMTMEALHASGGVPPGWRFTMLPGDPTAGRRVFVDFKCYACHAVKGEQFPLPPGETATAGPELTGMGGHHPVEYLAESVINPNAVLVDSPGFIGGDGRSIMPTYPDMTLGQLADVVAYLASLTAPDAMLRHQAAREQSVGGYRVRLEYTAPEGGDHAHHHGAAPSTGATRSRLLAFITDTALGQPLPYLPVKASIEVPGKPPLTVTLAPSLGPEGFHYGADVAIPEVTRQITLSIGATTMRLGAGTPPGLTRSQRVTFQWR
jgi:mono/diheme cytochrome c family protein